MSLIPIQIQVAIATVVAALIFSAGFGVEHALKTGEIASLKLTYEKQVNDAKDRVIAANARADAAEGRQRATLVAAATTYEQIRAQEKAQDEKTIADLRSAAKRLRVSTVAAPDRGRVPGAATCACGSDGQTQQTLSPTVAARLAGRYADYNALVDELNLCQTAVNAYLVPAPSAE